MTACLKIVTAAVIAAWTAGAWAGYHETMTADGPVRNLAADYGLVDDGAKSDQSAVFQRAIDELAAIGGGRLIVPRGTYRLAEVYLKSNIHLQIEKGTVLKPWWPAGTKTVLFILDTRSPSRRTAEQDRAFIENVSIRGLGGRFTVDYSDRPRREGEGVRAVLARMVRNFLIADMDIRDNYTVYCGITLTPTRSTARDAVHWPVSRATDGLIRDCRIFNASPGYGLVQLHGARSVHFENIYARGGVALRLETGAGGSQTGVFDITAKNVTCENGRCAVMLGPHSAVNGRVDIDGVTAISCAYAVTVGLGGVKKSERARNPHATDGRFADGSTIKNIRAVFGKNAQIKTHAILEIPRVYHDDLRLRPVPKFFDGPSIGAVRDTTGGHYRVVIEQVSMEGFEYYTDKPVLTPDDFPPGKWPEALRRWKATHGVTE